jgi:hypothetical protein
MRKRVQAEYLRKGFLLKRIYQVEGSYEEIKRPFRYQSAGGTTQSSGQLMSGFMHTDTSKTIKAITDLEYLKGDKVILDTGETFEITQVVTEGFNEFGRLRGIRRTAKILFIS